MPLSQSKRLSQDSRGVWVVPRAEEEEIEFKARNWEIKDLLCSVSLAHEALGYSLPVLGTPGFKPIGMNNWYRAACKAEPITRRRLGAVGNEGAMEG